MQIKVPDTLIQKLDITYHTSDQIPYVDQIPYRTLLFSGYPDGDIFCTFDHTTKDYPRQIGQLLIKMCAY